MKESNEIYTIDYNSSGHYFATGGIDMKIRIYDDEK